MTGSASSLNARAAELRAEFDRAYAEPLRIDSAVRTELLAIRTRAQAFALRLSEIAGLYADRKVTPVPGGGAALLGVAGFRGAILPVYDLGALLGEPGGEAPRWLVVAATAPVALAFDAFDGQLRVTEEAILPQSERSGGAPHAREVVRTDAGARPILHLPSIINALRVEPSLKEE